MPRNRTARLAVPASSVQRPASASYSPRSGAALRRRAVVVGLVLLSLVLITVYFRESDSGGLHGVQNAGATVLRPFEVAADRVARPFRDAYDYFAGLVNAKSEVDRLRRENAELRQAQIANTAAAQELTRIRRMLHYLGNPPYPGGYREVVAEVIAQPASQFDQQIVIAAGTKNGVHKNDAVVSGDGALVGTVSLAFSRAARVTLLTDESIAVSARDLKTGATGVIRQPQGSDLLAMDRVLKERKILPGDAVVTLGWRHGHLTSIYPKNIMIGTVVAAEDFDTENFKRVQVKPKADFSSLDSVIVLVPKGQRTEAP